MVFRRGLAFLCVAAAVALTDVGGGVDAMVHKRDHQQAKETEIKYPNGAVHISTQDDKAKQQEKHHHHHHRAKKAVDDDSSDDLKQPEHPKKKAVAKAGAADDAKEQVIKYDHGSVRISKPKSKDAHLHKATTVHEVHATTRKHHHKKGDVTQDFELKEGVNEFKVAGVPLKITVDDGKVDVNVAGKHVKSGGEVTVDADAVEKPAKKHHKAHHKQDKKAHKKEAAKAEKAKKDEKAEKVDKKMHKKEAAKAEETKKGEKTEKVDKKTHKKSHKKTAPKVEEAKKVEVAKVEETKVAATADSVKAVDEKADRVTELATKLAKDDHGFFGTQTAPIVFICGIIGALAAVVGIAAMAVVRAREHSMDDDVKMQSVLADSSELDIEAAVQTDAPADQSDSLDDSESDNDDEDGEGTFANNERVGTVSV